MINGRRIRIQVNERFQKGSMLFLGFPRPSRRRAAIHGYCSLMGRACVKTPRSFHTLLVLVCFRGLKSIGSRKIAKNFSSVRSLAFFRRLFTQPRSYVDGPLASVFISAVNGWRPSVICPACWRGLVPLALMKSDSGMTGWVRFQSPIHGGHLDRLAGR